VAPEILQPDWPAPPNVRALVTTRSLGDLKDENSRAKLRALLPADPCWLRQVHGVEVLDASRYGGPVQADASFTSRRNVVCAVMVADCMPVLLAEEGGAAVGIAHAGWRGLSAGVIEATVCAMAVPPARLLAWLGPAIGPDAYEVGDEVREAFMAKGADAAAAFRPARAGHWLVDLYAIARRRLAALGVARVCGGNLCTYIEKDRFFSFRRDKTSERMAAAIWLA